jgi:hypothetical protein
MVRLTQALVAALGIRGAGALRARSVGARATA